MSDVSQQDGHLADAPEPEEVSPRTLLREAVLRSVEQLDPNLRSVFVFREFKGLSTEETARLIGTSPGAVRTRLCRARKEVWRRVCDEFHPPRPVDGLPSIPLAPDPGAAPGGPSKAA